jgi:hypothetical protein
LAFAMLSTGCHIQVAELDVGPDKKAYAISCGETFARCEKEAQELCPDGYERIASRRLSDNESRLLTLRGEEEYSLRIECERAKAP